MREWLLYLCLELCSPITNHQDNDQPRNLGQIQRDTLTKERKAICTKIYPEVHLIAVKLVPVVTFNYLGDHELGLNRQPSKGAVHHTRVEKYSVTRLPLVSVLALRRGNNRKPLTIAGDGLEQSPSRAQSPPLPPSRLGSRQEPKSNKNTAAPRSTSASK